MKIFSIENKNGLKAQVTNYGGRIMSLYIPDRNGKFDDIVLGYDRPEEYLNSNEKYFGATIGRYGNRIAKAKFSLNGHNFSLASNNGVNCLHGGLNGFHNVYWDIQTISRSKIKMDYTSIDMEEGFPGNLKVSIIYHLIDSNELRIEYEAVSDKQTIINLTHHSFFNLSGDFRKTINNHILSIPAKYYTPVDSNLIPSGEIAPVEGTPFDFTKPVAIGMRLDEKNEQLEFGKGYDHNWVLDPTGLNKDIKLAARVIEPESGRIMEVLTNEPGIQFYGGNFLNGADVGKENIPYNFRTAFCLETQHFPDSPNQPGFPSTILEPGKKYSSICIYKFENV
jgi:aldose 1-epimerase